MPTRTEPRTCTPTHHHTRLHTRARTAGEVLLEVGTEDLDYMKITVLGHRKVLSVLFSHVSAVDDNNNRARSCC